MKKIFIKKIVFRQNAFVEIVLRTETYFKITKGVSIFRMSFTFFCLKFFSFHADLPLYIYTNVKSHTHNGGFFEKRARNVPRRIRGILGQIYIWNALYTGGRQTVLKRGEADLS